MDQVKRKLAAGSNASSPNPLCWVFDMMGCRIRDWKRFAKALRIDYLIRDLIENPDYKDIHEKISKCIIEKRETAVDADPDWLYWRTVLIQIDEGELVNDIEEKYPHLLENKNIDRSKVCHKGYDEFGIIAHDASKNDLFEKLEVSFKDRIEVCVGAGADKVFNFKVQNIKSIQDDYFEKYMVLEKVKRYDFSDIRRHEECKVLQTLHQWLQKHGDNGFCIKGYDVKQHLELVSKDYFNDNKNDAYILLYSQIHNVILYIDTNPDDIEKSIKSNRLNIRPLRTANPCLDKSSFVYMPVTLINPNEHIIDDKIVCKTCIDKKLVVSSETFQDIDLFENWWKNISSLIEDITCELSEQTDISNSLLKSILTYMALYSFSLPSFTKNPEKEIVEAQKLIMLTPEQQDIIYSKNKHKIIKGSYGTGKTIVAQKILKLVADSSDDSDIIYYLIHDTESSFLKEMKKVIIDLNKNNVIICKLSEITSSHLLSQLLNQLQHNNKGKRIHIFIEEFNAEILNKTEVTIIAYELEKKEYINSHIVVVAQSMESERHETDDSFQTIVYEKYKYEQLVEETDFKIFHLTYLLRSSQYINDLVNVTIPFLEKTKLKSFIPKRGSQHDYKSKLRSPINKDKTNNSNFNRFNETTESINTQKEVFKENNTAQDTKSTIAKIKENVIVDTCKFLKECTISSDQFLSKRVIESSYRYVGSRETAHKVKGKKPVIYYPFHKEHKKSSHQIYRLSEVLKLILNDNKKQAIICFNTDSINIVRNSLNISGIKWTSELESLSTEECLLTDYALVRGCEFLNVILIIPTDEGYLKHNLPDGINRCVLNLKLIKLDKVHTDETLDAILDEWITKKLVTVWNEDYLKNITDEVLKKFEENNRELFDNNHYESQNLDINDLQIIKKLKIFDRTPSEKRQLTSAAGTSIPINSIAPFKMFQDMWNILEISERTNDDKSLLQALQENNLDINSIYQFESNTANGSFLHYASTMNNLKIVKFLTVMNINTNIKDSNESTALHCAAKDAHVDIVKLMLLDDDIDVNLMNNFGDTPLLIAVKYNRIDIVKLLLQEDTIDVNICDDNGETPLHYAVLNNQIDIVKQLLQKDSTDINFANDAGATPLYIAVVNNHIEIIQLLLQQDDIDINAATQFGGTPLHQAVFKNNIDIVQLMLQQDEIDINATNAHVATPLHTAVFKNNIDIVQLLLQQDEIDINATSAHGSTPLHYAVGNNHIDIVQLLLQQDEIDINATSAHGATPLRTAVYKNNIDIVQLMLQQDAIDVNLQDEKGDSPLHFASYLNHIDIVEILLKERAIDVNVKGQNNYTPLHMAVGKNNIEIVKLLLQKDEININIINNNGDTPLDIAKRKNKIDIIKLMTMVIHL